MLHKPLRRSIGFSGLSLFMTVILQETRGACSLGAGCWVCWALQCAVSRCELRSGIFPCVCTRNCICGVSQFLGRLVGLHPASKCFSWLKQTANAHCNNTSWLSLLRHRNTGILDGTLFNWNETSKCLDACLPTHTSLGTSSHLCCISAVHAVSLRYGNGLVSCCFSFWLLCVPVYIISHTTESIFLCIL